MSLYDPAAIFAQKKLNNAASGVELPKAFTDRFPDLIAGRAETHFRKYLNAIMEQILPKLPFLNDGTTHISMKKLTDTCGTFKHKGERISLLKAFKDIYPLFNIEELGSNLKAAANPYEKNTRVKIVNERFIEALVAAKDPKEVFDHVYTQDDIDNNIEDVVYIDMENLERYIGCSVYELEKATEPNHRKKLQSSIWQARLVHKIGQYTEKRFDNPVLPLIPAVSPFGRTFYRGMNIQNVSKEVRSAIIGRHFQYDMNAAVFGIKLRLYGEAHGGDNELVGTRKGTYTREYLAEKNRIRERLAAHCFQGVQLPKAARVKAIKNALTAIGFGAKPQGKMWMTDEGLQGSALVEILKAPAVRDKFLDDEWVKAFIAEQKEMEADILAYKAGQPGHDEMCHAISQADGVNGKVSASRKMSYLYQHEETVVMDQAIATLARFGITPIARIHDAFLVREKLAPRVMDEIKAGWRHRDYLSLDCEEVREWVDPAYKRARDEADAEEQAHEQRLDHADVQARIYAVKMRQAQHKA